MGTAFITPRKFILVTDEMTYIDPNATHRYGLWLTDYMWYNKNKQELENWMAEYDVELSGMIIKFRTDEDRTLFILRWQ